MVQPINYGIQVPSAFESLVSGLKLGTSLQEMQAQREQRALQAQAMQQKMEAERQRQEVLRDFYGKAKADQPLTVADWLRFGEASGSAEYQKLASAQIQAMPEAQQQANAGFMGQTMVALWKTPEIGMQLLRDRVSANPEDKGLQAILRMAEMDPKAASVGLYGMAYRMGGKFADVAKNVAETLGMKEAAPPSPEAQRKAVADATQAEADAQIKLTNAETQAERNKAELELKRAQAKKAQAEAEGRGTPLVQVSTGDKADAAYATKVASLGAEEDTTLVATARKAPETIQKIDNTLRQIYSSPAITGAFADVIKGIERVRAKFGNQYAEGRVSASEVLDSMLGSEVFPMIGELGIGARGLDTPAEREFLRQVMTGTLSLDRNTIARLAEMRRNRVERSVEDFNNRVDQGELDPFFGARRQKPFRVAIPPRPARPSNMPAPPESAPAGSIQRESPPAQQPLAPAGGPSPIRGLSNEEILRRLRGQ